MNRPGRILVIGATGFLGRGLTESGSEMVPAAREPEDTTGWVRVDLEDSPTVERALDEVDPAWVVNTAAVTSVDGCEKDPALARRIHVDAVSKLAQACGERRIRLLQLSTNYVFDGEAGPYGEEDEAHPLSVYGRTKLEGEAVALSECEACVVRTAVLFGFQSGVRPNFVTWALSALQEGESIQVVTDEWANPTWLPDLVTSIRGLTEKGATGVVHVAGRDYLTRYEMVEALCDVFGLRSDLVKPVRSADLGQAARRPLRAGLRTDRVDRLLGSIGAPYRQHLETMKAAGTSG